MVGALIKNARAAKGISAAFLAEKVGLTQSTISRVESGERELSEEKLSLVAKVLEMDDNEIFLAAGVIPSDLKEKLLNDPKLFRKLRED